jgi:hypothetical protein
MKTKCVWSRSWHLHTIKAYTHTYTHAYIRTPICTDGKQAWRWLRLLRPLRSLWWARSRHMMFWCRQMDTCMCVCVYVSMCLCVYVSMCLCVYVCMCMCVCVYVCMCVWCWRKGNCMCACVMCVCMYVLVYTVAAGRWFGFDKRVICMHVCMHVCFGVEVWIPPYVWVCVHTYVCMYVCMLVLE